MLHILYPRSSIAAATLAVLILCALWCVSIAQHFVHTGWFTVGHRSYTLFHPRRPRRPRAQIAYREAEQICMDAEGGPGGLSRIPGEREQQRLFEVLKRTINTGVLRECDYNVAAYFGITRRGLRAGEGWERYLDGSQVGYTNWDDLHGEHALDQACAVMKLDGKWYPDHCDARAHGLYPTSRILFFCEKIQLTMPGTTTTRRTAFPNPRRTTTTTTRRITFSNIRTTTTSRPRLPPIRTDPPFPPPPRGRTPPRGPKFEGAFDKWGEVLTIILILFVITIVIVVVALKCNRIQRKGGVKPIRRDWDARTLESSRSSEYRPPPKSKQTKRRATKTRKSRATDYREHDDDNESLASDAYVQQPVNARKNSRKASRKAGKKLPQKLSLTPEHDDDNGSLASDAYVQQPVIARKSRRKSSKKGGRKLKQKLSLAPQDDVPEPHGYARQSLSNRRLSMLTDDNTRENSLRPEDRVKRRESSRVHTG